MKQYTVNRRVTTQYRSFVRRIVSISVSEAITKSWVWLSMIALAGGGTYFLFLAVTNAQDARENKPQLANPGWLTFDQCIVVAPDSYEIAAKESGTLAELTISENDLVKIDQPIGQIDSEFADTERQLAGIQAQMATSDAVDESGIRLAENRAYYAAIELESSEEILNKGGASNYDVRQKRLAVEQENWVLKQRKVEFQKRQLQAKQAAFAYRLADLKVERLKLGSPATGTVARIDRREGEWVAAGTTIAKVIRLDELRVDFFVDEKHGDITLLLHQPVTITADFGSAGVKSFAGKITGYASEVSSTGKVRMNATVQNQQTNGRWVLLPGKSVVLKLIPKSQ